MARRSDAEAIYHAADLFRQRCLIDDTSLLWPDHQAWTIENLNVLWSAFIEQPDEGKRSFMEKWRDQLAEKSADVHRVAADLMVLYYMFAWNIGTDGRDTGPTRRPRASMRRASCVLTRRSLPLWAGSQQGQ